MNLTIHIANVKDFFQEFSDDVLQQLIVDQMELKQNIMSIGAFTNMIRRSAKRDIDLAHVALLKDFEQKNKQAIDELFDDEQERKNHKDELQNKVFDTKMYVTRRLRRMRSVK